MPGDRFLRQMHRPWASPLFITAVYLAAGFAWIFLTDAFLEALPAPMAAGLQTVKGTLFVAVTGAVLFTLLEARHRGLRKSAEALRDSEREHRAVVEAAAEGVATLDLSGRATFMNPRLREILALDGRDDAVLLERVDDEGRSAAVETFRQALRGSSRRITVRLLAADGKAVQSELSMAPLPGNEGGVRGVVVMVSDLTERIAVEAERDRARSQLEESVRHAALGRLASKLAHEFNNVLMGILPFVEVVRRLAGSDPKVEQATANIVRSVDRGKAITHDLLGFTRLAKPEIRGVPLRDWLARVVDEMRVVAGEKVDVALEVEPGPLTILADPDQLRQALVNLARETCASMPSGGKLAIHAGSSGGGGFDAGSRFVRVTVKGDGPAIPPEVVPHMFEPLSAIGREGRGHGLALPLAHQIAINNGGQLTVESAEGGSAFVLLVPGSRDAFQR